MIEIIKHDVFTRINEKYNTLTNAERKVVDYILANKSEVQYMTITTLAQNTNVADATIFRFCRSLGFSGYNDFKLSLVKSMVYNNQTDESYAIYGEVKPDDSIDDMIKKIYNSQVEALTQTMQLQNENSIVKAVNYLCSSEKVYFMGQGGSSVLAMDALSRFMGISNKFFHLQDSHLQGMAASLLNEYDCIVFFSYSGNTRDIMDVLPTAYKQGIKIILITGFPQSDAAKYSNVILQCSFREGPLQMGSMATKIAQLYVAEILYNEFYRRNINQAIKNLEITTQAIARKML